ncbi:MAG: hypothetical protein ACP5T2_06640 [Thermoprotei archaeon]
MTRRQLAVAVGESAAQTCAGPLSFWGHGFLGIKRGKRGRGAEEDQREVEEKMDRLKVLYDLGAITQSDFE